MRFFRLDGSVALDPPRRQFRISQALLAEFGVKNPAPGVRVQFLAPNGDPVVYEIRRQGVNGTFVLERPELDEVAEP